MSDAEVAEVLGGGVTPARVRGMLRRASRAIPLVADPEPFDVVHEDDELLVVNKPPGAPGSIPCIASRGTVFCPES